jgi:hypothetical protein
MVIPLLIAFALPATAAVIYATFRPLWRDTIGPSEVAGTYKAITLQAVLFVLVLYALALATLADVPGLRPIAPRAVAVLLGVFFVGVGNLLPRTRPNLLIGLRTARTLDDRELWARIHRICGYLAVGFGLSSRLRARSCRVTVFRPSWARPLPHARSRCWCRTGSFPPRRR